MSIFYNFKTSSILKLALLLSPIEQMKILNLSVNCICLCTCLSLIPILTFAQYSCETTVQINTLPFEAFDLSTSIGASYQASSFCGNNTNYNEQDYILEYTSKVEENLNIYVEKNSGEGLIGLYVFLECGQPPSACVEMSEDVSGFTSLSLITDPGETYYIFVGTPSTSEFYMQITKETVNGVAINKTSPTQTLDVNGTVRVGSNENTPYEGTIRWNSKTKTFEGYNGETWISFHESKKFGNQTVFGDDQSLSFSQAFDSFGSDVAIHREYAVAGMRGKDFDANTDQGQAFIYEKKNGNWELTLPFLTASDGEAGDFFGNVVAIGENDVFIASDFKDIGANTSQGKVYVFRMVNGVWSEVQTLQNANGVAFEGFGNEMFVEKDIAFIANKRSQIFVYLKLQNLWQLDTVLTVIPEKIQSFEFSYYDDILVVGSDKKDNNTGHLKLFHRSNNVWSYTGEIKASDGMEEEFFGEDIAFHRNVIAASSRKDNGRVYIYEKEAGEWLEKQVLKKNSINSFGNELSIYDNYLLVSTAENINGNAVQGSAFLYCRSFGEWQEEFYTFDTAGGQSDAFGFETSMYDDNIIIAIASHDGINGQNTGRIIFY